MDEIFQALIHHIASHVVNIHIAHRLLYLYLGIQLKSYHPCSLHKTFLLDEKWRDDDALWESDVLVEENQNSEGWKISQSQILSLLMKPNNL